MIYQLTLNTHTTDHHKELLLDVLEQVFHLLMI